MQMRGDNQVNRSVDICYGLGSFKTCLYVPVHVSALLHEASILSLTINLSFKMELSRVTDIPSLRPELCKIMTIRTQTNSSKIGLMRQEDEH
jgi:hypothetical protein